MLADCLSEFNIFLSSRDIMLYNLYGLFPSNNVVFEDEELASSQQGDGVCRQT
jgi:hypothetical protein